MTDLGICLSNTSLHLRGGEFKSKIEDFGDFATVKLSFPGVNVTIFLNDLKEAELLAETFEIIQSNNSLRVTPKIYLGDELEDFIKEPSRETPPDA